MPAVSLIVPNYNHARFLRRRIDSILDQSYQDFEVTLLDDCWPTGEKSLISASRSKVAMLKTVKAIDPHPIRRVLRPALLTARLKIQRHWRATFGLS